MHSRASGISIRRTGHYDRTAHRSAQAGQEPEDKQAPQSHITTTHTALRARRHGKTPWTTVEEGVERHADMAQ
jgi:hypothetical protein